MSSVVGSLETALQANKLEQVSLIMDRFETQVENMGVQTAYMDTAMAGSTSLSTPEDQVMGLMQQVADEHGLELKQQLGNVPMTNRRVTEEEASEKDSLAERLAKLRNL
jgi:charged multivesicular body protein 1